MKGLNDLYNNGSNNIGLLRSDQAQAISNTAYTLRNTGVERYYKAYTSYTAALSVYKNLNRASATSSIENIILETSQVLKDVSNTIHDSKIAIDFIKDQTTKTNTASIDTVVTNLNTWNNTTSNDISSIQSVSTNIQSSKDSIESTSRDIAQKTASLDKLKNGADALDIESEQLSLQQKQKALSDYYIRAPFDGVVGKLDISNIDTVSSGEVVATLISKQKVADISLNEVDAAKVKSGDKATLTFDAVENLTISGTVADIDLVGTVTQGVVTYNAKIAFDVNDDRIKPGMSVSTSIITNVASDVLVVPNSAIKTSGQISYVEIFSSSTSVTTGNAGVVMNKLPTQQEVEVGMSNDTNTQILSGLNEGDKIVTRTIAGSALTQTTTQAPSILSGATNRGTGSAGFRAGATGR